MITLSWLVFRSHVLAFSLVLALTPSWPERSFALPTNRPDNIPAQQPDEMPLVSGSEIEQEIEPGKLRSFRINLRVGEYLRLSVNQLGTSVFLKLFGPAGNELTDQDDDQTVSGSENFSWIAKVSGSHRLEVRVTDKAPAGRFRLKVIDLRRATQNDKQSFARDMQLRLAKQLEDQVQKLYQEGKYQDAIRIAEQSLQLRRHNLPPLDIQLADSLHDLASLLLITGDYTRAEPFFKESMGIREQKLGQDDLQVARSLNSLAGVAQEVGNYETAETLFKRALAIRQAKLPPTHVAVAQSMNNLALLYTAKKDYQQSERLFVQAHETLKKGLGHEKHQTIANSLNGLAVVYQEQGDLVRAEPLYKRALEIQESLLGPNHPTVANTIHNLAVLYLLNKDFDRAEPLYRRAADTLERTLGLRHPRFANALESIGIMYQVKGDVDRALEFHKRASDIREANLALVIASGSEREKRLYIDTLDMQTNIAISFHVRSAPENASAARLALTTILRRKGRVLDAVTDSLEALRRRSKPEDHELLNQLSAVRTQLATVVLNGLGQRTREQQEAEINRLETEAQRLEGAISNKSVSFRNPGEPITLEQVQQTIPTDAALVEITTYRPFDSTAKIKSQATAPPRYVAYVLRHDGTPTVVDLGETSSIDTTVGQFREVLATPTSDVKKIARSLDEAIMRPIRQLLGATTNVFLSTDGALNLVPFVALLDEQDRYLVEKYRMTYLTSGRDLLRFQTREHSAAGPMIAFASPAFDGRTSAQGRNIDASHQGSPSKDVTQHNFQPLPGTSKEAQALKAILPRLEVLVGPRATESAIKRVKHPSILHVATHGFFLSDKNAGAMSDDRRSTATENPLLRSGLVLAGANQRNGGNGEDGILTALEAAGLDLWGTKIVVLSACETGVGDVRNGDGVYGLRRALVLAGSESQVMSLWKVDDDATKDLMVDFYKQLQQGVGRTEALRQVQLRMLKSAGQSQSNNSRAVIAGAGAKTSKDLSRSHPYYWASFIQSGDWRSLGR